MARLKPKDRRQLILMAAMALSRDKGYLKFNKYDIAKALECAPNLLFYYFKTMEGLREAVMQEAVRIHDLNLIAQGLANKHPVAIALPYGVRRQASLSIMGEN